MFLSFLLVLLWQAIANIKANDDQVIEKQLRLLKKKQTDIDYKQYPPQTFLDCMGTNEQNVYNT